MLTAYRFLNNAEPGVVQNTAVRSGEPVHVPGLTTYAPTRRLEVEFTVGWEVRSRFAAQASTAWPVHQRTQATASTGWQVRQRIRTVRSTAWPVHQRLHHHAVTAWTVDDPDELWLILDLPPS